MRSYALLLAEDEESFRELLKRRLSRKGYLVTAVASGTEALDALAEEEFDAAIFDMKMPGLDGIATLKRAREIQPGLPVLILTGHGSIETAVEAIRAGAYDYLTKPCNLAELEVILERALERRALEVENRGLREALRRLGDGLEIVGRSEPLRRLLELTERVAQGAMPVLIEGESGTGKELIARAVHQWSPRAAGPFIPVNAGALPAQLLESELFGHARGAFTGAVAAKPGLVELAGGGTLFLDEIGEMPLEVQAKLLRFLETHEVRRVGETRIRRVDVRIVAATNRRLADEVRAGRFREDLYYRLNVVALHVPPLRERREDIPLLVEHFLARLGSAKEMTPEALEALMRQEFRGNVRELYNLVQRGVILSPDRFIAPEDLGLTVPPARQGAPTRRGAGPSAEASPGDGGDAGEEFASLEQVERAHIARALERTGWNRAQAAQLLGVSVRTLYRKIEGYGLRPGQ
ncbi:DNA-binding NtrC family response regulator [Symbiobacterium terraclitae]|uniref:Stage 0 sporulation protein A homolog n=1 Tax=Symbiobacterium terraclitae TaxID=557451 RepID=A0ABS4JRF7_9FIRM|nr:sigma-54 dependent transcriptional regulator [Symbiobacterium terraclitae]MBP2018100.1 DNA-binding NtrC family response regulator [Symbiobacterium terraclitae]